MFFSDKKLLSIKFYTNLTTHLDSIPSLWKLNEYEKAYRLQSLELWAQNNNKWFVLLLISFHFLYFFRLIFKMETPKMFFYRFLIFYYCYSSLIITISEFDYNNASQTHTFFYNFLIHYLSLSTLTRCLHYNLSQKISIQPKKNNKNLETRRRRRMNRISKKENWEFSYQNQKRWENNFTDD